MDVPVTPSPPLPKSSRPKLGLSGAAGAGSDVPWEAIDRCVNGDSLLKFGRAGEPHFRVFRLSPDFASVQWTSKGREQSVSLDDVRRQKQVVAGSCPESRRRCLSGT